MINKIVFVVISAWFLIFTCLSAAQDNRVQLGNNTSGCDYDQIAFSTGHCSGQFIGMVDNNAAGANRLQGDGEYNAHVTNAHDVPVSRIGEMVSTIDIHSLLYSGNQTLVLAGYQPWFDVCHYNGEFQTTYPLPSTNTFPANGYQTCLGTAEIGYNSSNETFVEQLADLSRRGFNGVIVDWYGQGNTHNDSATQQLSSWDDHAYCTGIQQCSMYWALMEDQGSWNSACAPNATTDQTNCIITHLNADFDYMNLKYFNPSGMTGFNGAPTHGYLKLAPTGPASNPWQVSATGRPLVFLFIPQSAWVYPVGSPNAGQPNANWTTIWNTVRSHLAGLGANEPYLIFENGNSFSHTLFPQSDGGFAWISHWTNDTTHCTFTTASDPEGLCLLYHFYQSAVAATESWSPTTPMIDVGAAWKGFDNTYAGWRELVPANSASASIIPARCGQTWLDTFARANAAFSTAKQLPILQVATWNDYDEGHEIETGIENCWNVSASMQQGSTVINWSLTAANVQTNAVVNATQNTVDHYEIWVYVPNSGSAPVANAVVPSSQRSFDLSTLSFPSGTYGVVVYEVSKPSIRNQVSSELTYVRP
jgi:hypothetical protein